MQNKLWQRPWRQPCRTRSDMKTEEAYKCQTGMTAVMGISVVIVLFVISLFI